MSDVRIAEKRIWVGNESRALLSGEVHYWRLAPPRWGTILGRVRDIGLDVISTYVCWQYHEVAAGRLDFRGTTEPQRDLVRFLDLVSAQNFWLMFRPGPYIYSEWVNMGVPDRVAHLHRLHPDFLKAAREYMAAVVEVARPYFASKGGPIVLFQADNEADSLPRFYETQLGLGREPGPFQDYLRTAYRGDIAALNDRWETDLKDFEAARAVTRPAITTRGHLNRYLDFRRFQYDYNTQIVHWTADTYRELGVDVPIYFNHYASHEVQNWRDLEAAGQIAGPDYYTYNEFRRDATEHQEFLHQLRYTRTYSALPVIPEFQGGIWHSWHYQVGALTPRHYRLAGLSALLAGIAGWNWYMLVNRDNWYMCPINEWGRVRMELFAAFKQVIALYREIDPPSLRKLTQTSLALDILDRSANLDGSFSDPVLTALYQAGLDYECYDTATGQIAGPLMFYGGHGWLSRAGQQRLLDYVEKGGHLVFFQELPLQDETLRPLNLLGLRQPDSVLDSYTSTLHIGDETAQLENQPFFCYETDPDQPLWIERQLSSTWYAEEEAIHYALPVGTRYTPGYHERRGQGTLTVLGVPPDPAVVLAVHRWLGVPIPCRARVRPISTALFQRDETYYVMAVNNSDTPQDVLVDLDRALFQPGAYRVRDLSTGAEQSAVLHDTGQIVLFLPAKDGTVARITRDEK